jgi:hypothetical protein
MDTLSIVKESVSHAETRNPYSLGFRSRSRQVLDPGLADLHALARSRFLCRSSEYLVHRLSIFEVSYI